MRHISHITYQKSKDKRKRLFRVPCSVFRDHKGFTLIEAVVATAVFAFVIVSVLGVYLATLQLDSRTRAQRAVTQNARFIMEYLAKEVRNGRVDYGAYSGGNASNINELFIRNQLDESERIFISNQNLILAKGGDSTNLNSSEVKVSDVKFIVSPLVEPYTPAKNANVQPHVTVIMKLSANLGNRQQDQSAINLQSTFSTRYYPQRQ